jgi:hypothetical protein
VLTVVSMTDIAHMEKVKQSRYRPEQIQRVDTSIALPFRDLGAVCGQRQAPAAFSAEKNRYPLYTRMGEPQSRSGRVRKILP